MTITCGIDWAEAHHDVAVMDGDGRILGRAKIDTGLAGFGQLLPLLAEHGDDPAAVPVAIETDHADPRCRSSADNVALRRAGVGRAGHGDPSANTSLQMSGPIAAGAAG